MRISSAKPGKQRKLMYTAPVHIRRKMMSAPLSKELRLEYKTRSLPIREGDVVMITRGDYAGIEGKVLSIDAKKYRIHVEGVKREKVDGTPVYVPINPSKVVIKKLNIDDDWRKEILERRRMGKVTIKEAGGK